MRTTKLLCASLLLAFAAASKTANSAVAWPEVSYGYYANNARLDTVMADFASTFGLSLSMPTDLQGTVNGRFAFPSPTEFLIKMSGIYGFVWYTHAGTLHISRASDIVTKGVTAPGGNVGALKKALVDLGVLEPRFGWGELADHGMALVSGPPGYVNLIEATIRNLPARAQQFKVFHLKHASATDRSVTYRDQQISTPGLASILRSMVSGNVNVISPSAIMGAPGSPRNQGAGSEGTASANSGANPTTPATGSVITAAGGAKPTVIAEPRLNAIIVQDLPERMPVYEQLIAQLDMPTAQVEIEAMIIDISTDRANELGIDWTGRIGRTSLSFGDPSATATAGARFAFSSGSAAAGNFLISQIKLLETKGDAEIRSRPSVLTAENLTALLDLSDTFYIRIQGERVANVIPVTAGTTLKVTPHVVKDVKGTWVRLKIDIEDGRISDQQVDTLPIVARTNVSTEATVREGEALLIAGYASDRNVASRRQIPVVGDIPGVGNLFATNSRTNQKRERIFLIRPKIVPELGRHAEAAPPTSADDEPSRSSNRSGK